MAGLLLFAAGVTRAAPGEDIYYACSMCHGTVGEGSEARDAPPLAGMPEWYLEAQLQAFRDGRRGGDTDTMTGRQMALFAQALPSEAALQEVAGYAAALPRAQGAGGAATGQPPAGFAACASCHGLQGEGNQALGAPPIAGQPRWYLTKQLMAFRDGHRGLQPDDTPGLQMRAAMASLPQDDEAFQQLVAFISALRHPGSSLAD